MGPEVAPLNKILQYNVLNTPWPFPDESIDCCVTSPPYWALRNYGMADQIGMEHTPELYIQALVKVFEEVKRVLKPTGTLWLNLGDTYYGGKGSNGASKAYLENKNVINKKALMATSPGDIRPNDRKIDGLKPKDLIGIPWMVAFALRAAGWYLRQDIIWSKPNPMPESIADRCTKSHEYIFLLSKSRQYYYDQDAIRVPLKDESIARLAQDIEQQKGSDRVPGKSNCPMKAVMKFHPIGGSGKYTLTKDPLQRTKSGKDWTPYMAGSGQINNGRSGYYKDGKLLVRPTANKKSAWTSNDNPYRAWEWLFANAPDEIVIPPWEAFITQESNKDSFWSVTTKPFKAAHFATFPEELITPCILAGCPKDGIVLDPFMGAGTTALVALSHGRKFTGFELNPEYITIANKRLKQKFGMFFNPET